MRKLLSPAKLSHDLRTNRKLCNRCQVAMQILAATWALTVPEARKAVDVLR